MFKQCETLVTNLKSWFWIQVQSLGPEYWVSDPTIPHKICWDQSTISVKVGRLWKI